MMFSVKLQLLAERDRRCSLTDFVWLFFPSVQRTRVKAASLSVHGVLPLSHSVSQTLPAVFHEIHGPGESTGNTDRLIFF